MAQHRNFLSASGCVDRQLDKSLAKDVMLLNTALLWVAAQAQDAADLVDRDVDAAVFGLHGG